jgi:hypothetical protein
MDCFDFSLLQSRSELFFRTAKLLKVSTGFSSPGLETQQLETPLLETPVLETPVLEIPVLETQQLETPLLETPVLETPVLETPLLETPVLETPVLETLIMHINCTFVQNIELCTDWCYYVMVKVFGIRKIDLPDGPMWACQKMV